MTLKREDNRVETSFRSLRQLYLKRRLFRVTLRSGTRQKKKKKPPGLGNEILRKFTHSRFLYSSINNRMILGLVLFEPITSIADTRNLRIMLVIIPRKRLTRSLWRPVYGPQSKKSFPISSGVFTYMNGGSHAFLHV